jgi:transcriptional regulator with XRE-family HTH domain
VTLSRDVLAKRIRDAIAESGATQQDVARATSMDPTALSKALAGRREFKSLEVALIAEQLGLSTQWLLADDNETPGTRGFAAGTAYVEYDSMDELIRDLDLTEEDTARAGERIDDHVRAWHLARLRRAHGRSQRQLAEAMHVPQPRVHHIEHGNTARTTVDDLRAYCRGSRG